MEHTTTHQKLYDFIRNLPEKDKILLALYYYENLSLEEIAYILEQPEAEKIKNRICYLKIRDIQR